MSEQLSNIVFIDDSGLPCFGGVDPCAQKERTISFAQFVVVPEQIETPEEIFKECCYKNYVLASSTNDALDKNDFTGFFHFRQNSGETVEFVLIKLIDLTETPLNDDTYGTFKDFGDISDNPDLSTFVIDWRSVLLDGALGPQPYKVVKRISTVGLSIEIEYLVYNLQEFSDLRADKTVRLDCTMSGLLEKSGIDFTGSDFSTSIRVPGFFGRREPQYEEDNIVNRNYTKRQISSLQTNEYKFQTNQIPDCVQEEIIDFILFSDDVRMNDYNLVNTSYKYKDFAVKLENNEGSEYLNRSRKVKLNLVFSDKVVNNNKRNF